MAGKRKRDPLEDLEITDLEKMIEGWRTWARDYRWSIAEDKRRCAFCFGDVGNTEVLASVTSAGAPITYVCPDCYSSGKVFKAIKLWLSWIEIKNGIKI